jgi:hypothetical protein
MSRKIPFLTPNTSSFSKSYKYDISDKMDERFDFPTVGGSIYSSRIAMNRQMKGRDRTGAGRCVRLVRLRMMINGNGKKNQQVNRV